MAKGARLPDSITVPIDLLFAQGIGDGPLVTLLRLMALGSPGGSTPSLPPDQLAKAVGRSRTTLYRHLRLLASLPAQEQSQGQGRVEVRVQSDGLAVRPVGGDAGSGGSAAEQPAEARPPVEARPWGADPDPAYAERHRALAHIGIVEPKLSFLARLDLDLAWIEGWARWLQAQGRHFRNPQGYVIRRLESRQAPPAQYLRVAADPWADWGPPEAEASDEASGEDLEETGGPEPEVVEGAAADPAEEALAIWRAWLKTAQAVVGAGTFGRYVAGASVMEAGPDRLVIGAVDEAAVRWLEQFAGDSLRRAWREGTGRPGDVAFVVRPLS